MIKLFVVGFPRDMREIELLELFTLQGQVDQVTIITDKDSGESKGYAFVQMTDQHGADRAIAALNGLNIGEREISVRIAEDKRSVQAPPVQENRRYEPENRGYQKVAKVGYDKKKRPRKSF